MSTPFYPVLLLSYSGNHLEQESKRLLITEIMANAFRTILATTPDDLLPAGRAGTSETHARVLYLLAISG